MDFLGNLCVCEGRAIPSTQSEFSDALINNNIEYYNLLYYGRCNFEEVSVPT